jgi:hypothetical protein
MEELGVDSGSQSPFDAAPSDTPAEEGELPDWLQRVRSRQQSEQGEAGETGGAESPEAGDLPDWLSGPGDEPAAQEPSPGIPDWLSPGGEAALEKDHSVSGWLSGVDSQPGAQTPSSGTTDWLSGLGGEPAPLAVTGAAGEGAPDWLGQLPSEFAGATAASEPPTGAGVQPFGEAAFGDQEEPAPPAGDQAMPDWLSSLGAEAVVGSESTQKAPTSPAGSVPAFVMDQGEEEPSGEAFKTGEDLSGLTEGEPLSAMPEWISQVSAEQSFSAQGPGAEGEADADLAPAQLPTWLEAMRPVEAAAPTAPTMVEETDASVESAGPLAGLRGALPAEAEITRFRKPPVYSNKLLIDEKQQATIGLLQDLVAAEGQARPAPARAAISSQYILRIIIALALLGMVAYTLAFNTSLTPMPKPADIPAEVIDFQNRIGGLPADAQVLIAFDYEPAMAGEMESAAVAVFSQLNQKGASLTFISTSPVGPAMAESFLDRLGVRYGISYTNFTSLGYLPGGPAGLQAFARQPQLVTPHNLEGFVGEEEARVWAGPLAQGLAGFGMVIVMTENPDTARLWIEQVQPKLAQTTPLMMIISAQAEPMVRPYYNSASRQVGGMIVGLAGGAAYETATSYGDGPARRYWDALSASLLIAAILVLFGAVYNGVAVLLAQEETRKGEERA